MNDHIHEFQRICYLLQDPHSLFLRFLTFVLSYANKLYCHIYCTHLKNIKLLANSPLLSHYLNAISRLFFAVVFCPLLLSLKGCEYLFHQCVTDHTNELEWQMATSLNNHCVLLLWPRLHHYALPAKQVNNTNSSSWGNQRHCSLEGKSAIFAAGRGGLIG